MGPKWQSWRVSVPWAAWAFLWVPTSVLAHEAAHYIAGRLLGFRELEFRAMGVQHAPGNADWQRIAATLPGFTFSILLAWVAGEFAVRSVRSRPRAVAAWTMLCVAAPMRGAVWLWIAFQIARHHTRPIGPGSYTISGDEVVLATLTRTPVALWVGASTAAFLGSILLFERVLRSFPPASKRAVLFGSGLGLLLGWWFHLSVVVQLLG